MNKIRFLTGGALFVTLIAGFGYAVATERPITKIKNEAKTNEVIVQQEGGITVPTTSTTGGTSTSTPPRTSTTTKDTKPQIPTTPSDPNTYTNAQIAQHSTAGNCWTSINGSVYDLTSWVSRHPGGEGAIIRLCGLDGSAAFQSQHGSSRAARAALTLLKIGTLK